MGRLLCDGCDEPIPAGEGRDYPPNQPAGVVTDILCPGCYEQREEADKQEAMRESENE